MTSTAPRLDRGGGGPGPPAPRRDGGGDGRPRRHRVRGELRDPGDADHRAKLAWLRPLSVGLHARTSSRRRSPSRSAARSPTAPDVAPSSSPGWRSSCSAASPAAWRARWSGSSPSASSRGSASGRSRRPERRSAPTSTPSKSAPRSRASSPHRGASPTSPALRSAGPRSSTPRGRAVFLVNVPVGAIAVALLLASYSDPPRRPSEHRLDVGGAVLAAVSIACLLLAADRHLGGGASVRLALAASAVIALVALRPSRAASSRRSDPPARARPRSVRPRRRHREPLRRRDHLRADRVRAALDRPGDRRRRARRGLGARRRCSLAERSTRRLGVRVLVRRGIAYVATRGLAIRRASRQSCSPSSFEGQLPSAMRARRAPVSSASASGPAANAFLLGPQMRVPGRTRGVVTSSVHAARALRGTNAVAALAAVGDADASAGRFALFAILVVWIGVFTALRVVPPEASIRIVGAPTIAPRLSCQADVSANVQVESAQFRGSALRRARVRPLRRDQPPWRVIVANARAAAKEPRMDAIIAWALGFMLSWAPPGRSKIKEAVRDAGAGQGARYAEIARAAATRCAFRSVGDARSSKGPAPGRASTMALLLLRRHGTRADSAATSTSGSASSRGAQAPTRACSRSASARGAPRKVGRTPTSSETAKNASAPASR